MEWEPFYRQPDLLDYCREKEIVVQVCYNTTGGTESSDSNLMEHPAVKKIADKLGATCAQVLLVWALQQDIAVLSKSTTSEQFNENITLNFKICDNDMKLLNALGEQNNYASKN